MNKDIPIIFSAPMVNAFLDGRKTMTRRLALREGWYCACDRKRLSSKMFNSMGIRVCAKCGASGGLIFKSAPSPWQKVKAGDRLYVRENFTLVGGGDPGIPIYAANWREDARARGFDNIPVDAPKWTPCIHMPRWASRLTLDVTAIKIERLKDISHDDAVAEGCYRIEPCEKYPHGNAWGRAGFAALWEGLHGQGSWESNPEVVAITFTVHRQNIDAPKVAT